jgi:uncharacterized heparinase superfamily protein
MRGESSAATPLGGVLRAVETVRHLQPRQVAYGIYYRLFSPVLSRAGSASDRLARRDWLRPFPARSFLPVRQVSPGVFRAAGETGEIRTAADWRSPDRSRLWVFTVHYLDDLNACSVAGEAQRDLLDRWIADNPAGPGFAWHPYVISQRLVNVVKWCSRRPVCEQRWLESIDVQARSLARQFEYHILGNHLLANAKSLMFAGSFLRGPQADAWLRRGLREFSAQLDEQFLADGGHFELSPMYQSLVLWDVCDAVALAEATGLPEFSTHLPRWRSIVASGISWLEAMTHPDGLPSLFNDAAFGVSPTLEEVKRYAFDAVALPMPPPLPAVAHLRASGYIAVRPSSAATVLIDAAPVGPDYQPGHAHADTLSFELSLFDHRLIVNSGTSTYAENAARVAERSTAAHSTVEIDGINSSDVWRSFRVASRARPFGLHVQEEPGVITVRASHDGYRRLPGSPTHAREWTIQPRRLTVTDTVHGPHGRAVARFFLHPAVRVHEGGRLTMPGGESVSWTVASGTATIVPSMWHPEFGLSIPSHCIEVALRDGSQAFTLDW